jgi:hypothetical protein
MFSIPHITSAPHSSTVRPKRKSQAGVKCVTIKKKHDMG